jgi:hypothetical protein
MAKSASLPPRDERLLAADQPVIPVTARAGLDVRRIRPCAGLGDRKARQSVAFDRRDQVLRLLFVIAVVEDVVRLTAEAEGDERPAGLRPKQGLGDRRKRHPAVLLGRRESPEAELPGRVLQVAQLGPGDRWLPPTFPA